MVEVINLRYCRDWGKPGDVLIDRRTKWGNPFIMRDESHRNEVCDKYEIWLRDNLALHRLNLNELKHAKRLGCHCKPLRCHGDIIKRYLDYYEQRDGNQQSLNL